MTTKPIVSICCITFNHEKYIRDAIEGFLMQKTLFPFEILIHDDASTDRTSYIIREYEEKFPDVIKPIYQTENQYSKGISISATYQFPRARGKYIAMCEGDDYWTDPLKLQKQVDFLEKNPMFVLCVGGYTQISVYDNKSYDILKKVKYKKKHTGFDFTLNDTKDGWITKTLTAVFINKKELINLMLKYRYGRDVHLFYHLLKIGDGYYFEDIFGTYRVHKGGVHSMVNPNNLKLNACKIYEEMYGLNGDDYTKYKYFAALINYLSGTCSKNKFETNKRLLAEIFSLIDDFKYAVYFIKLFTINIFWIFYKRLRYLVKKLS